MKPRILVIRGGAIGDFILTLPALRMLRETFAHCHLEILGYPHIAALALQGGPVADTTYADAVQPIEAGALAGFFARNGNLAPELCEYFGSFQQVVSWLFDPDAIFENNIKRAGVKHYLSAYAKITDQQHATAQLAYGLQSMALYLEDQQASLVPSAAAAHEADAWLSANLATPFVAIHPGSGSSRKNWPVEKWTGLIEELRAAGKKILITGGEADRAVLDALKPKADAVAIDFPLPVLGAVLARAEHYHGNDTGISHLAAAVGTPSTLRFGPTDPAIWAPRGEHVKVEMMEPEESEDGE